MTWQAKLRSRSRRYQELLQRRHDLTAVFVFNDMMALGVMNALRAQGMRIPEDISIIGYDNIVFASTFEAALTTIAQPIAAIGQECITQLYEFFISSTPTLA